MRIPQTKLLLCLNLILTRPFTSQLTRFGEQFSFVVFRIHFTSLQTIIISIIYIIIPTIAIIIPTAGHYHLLRP